MSGRVIALSYEARVALNNPHSLLPDDGVTELHLVTPDTSGQVGESATVFEGPWKARPSVEEASVLPLHPEIESERAAETTPDDYFTDNEDDKGSLRFPDAALGHATRLAMESYFTKLDRVSIRENRIGEPEAPVHWLDPAAKARLMGILPEVVPVPLPEPVNVTHVYPPSGPISPGA